MNSKTFLIAALVAVGLLFASPSLADSGYDIIPLKAEAPLLDRGPVNSQATDYNIPLYIHRRYVDDSNYYLASGAAGDTFATYFRPLAACSLYFFHHEMFDTGSGEAFLWKPNPDWLAAFPNGRAVSRSDQYLSPLGDVLVGPVSFTSPGRGWVSFMEKDQLNIYFGDSDNSEVSDGQADWKDGFLAGWVKQGFYPHPMSDDVTARGFTYTWFGGPWTVDVNDVVQWGWYNVIIENMVEIGVSYPWGAPPIFEKMTQVANTVDPQLHVSVDASVFDDDGWTVEDEWVSLHVRCLTPDAEADTMVAVSYDSLLMSQVDGMLFASEIDLSSKGLKIGDRVEYWISALDNTGAYSSEKDSPYSFDIISFSSPNATVLWVDDGQYNLSGELHLTGYNDLPYLSGNADASLDMIETYDMTPDKPFDPGLFTARTWDFVLITGEQSDFVPLGQDGYRDAFDTMLASGANFVYVDQGYAFGHVGADQASVSLGAGDFAYDVFGITSIANDPVDADSYFDGPAFISYDFGANGPQQVLYVPEYLMWDADQDYFTLEDGGAAVPYIVGLNDSLTYCVNTTSDAGGELYHLAYSLVDRGYDEEYPHWYSDPAILDMLVILGGLHLADVAEDNSAALTRWSLAPANPNPFNPSTTLSYTVPQAGPVTLEVFDITGRLVSTLQSGIATAGTHRVTFDGSGLASGTYLVRMRSEGFSAVQRMVLIK